MSSNQTRKHSGRVKVLPALHPRIFKFIEEEHCGDFNSAVNALLLRELNARDALTQAGQSAESAA